MLWQQRGPGEVELYERGKPFSYTSGGSEGVNQVISEGKKENFQVRRSPVYKGRVTWSWKNWSCKMGRKKFLPFKPVMGLKSANKIKKLFVNF